MADTEEESDLDRSEITTRESLSATSSLESPSSPRSVDSDWSFPGRQDSDELSDGASGRHGGVTKQSSIVDCLLFEIYDHYHARYSVDSDNVTECSTASGSVFGGSSFDFEESRERWTKSSLQSKDTEELEAIAKEIRTRISMLSAKLVKHLKRRDKHAYKLQRNFDVLTAVLQAVSLKRRVDTRIRFSFIPQSGKRAFRQWLAAFKAIARLPHGVPSQWRKRLWLCLAESKLQDIDWGKTVKLCFNEKSNPDDDELGSQIVKDLHRTGCGWFCGQDTPEERASLKRVLLAFARWNKSVGYCQGFNVIAALILQVMDRDEDDALKVMIYLIDHVLPMNYFANNLRALSVDMAVVRDLMRVKLPRLSKHLDDLQSQAQAVSQDSANPTYEPPLINAFTMQWFLTLFATSLPEETVLRVWDSILLEGSEVLLRVALAIWGKLGDRLEDVETSDDFYCTMGLVMQDLSSGDVIDCVTVVKEVYGVAPFPLPGLAELREQYTYNIHPFSGGTPNDSSHALGHGSSDEEEEDFDFEGAGCLGMLLPFSDLNLNSKSITETGEGASDIAAASSGVFVTEGYSPEEHALKPKTGRVQRELSFLQKQYTKMRRMQQQAVVVFSEAAVQNIQEEEKRKSIPAAINHLLVSATKPKARAHKQYPSSRGREKGASDESKKPGNKSERDKAEENTYKRESIAHLNSLFRGNQKESKSASSSGVSVGDSSRAEPSDPLASPKTDEPVEKVPTVKANGHFRIQMKSNAERATTKPATASKLHHMGLNGEVSSMEAPKNDEKHQSQSLVAPSQTTPAKVTVINASALNGRASAVKTPSTNSAMEVVKHNSPSVLDGVRKKVCYVSRKPPGAVDKNRPSVRDAVSRPWLADEDKRCKYPSNFNPFPQRKKATSRSKILYGGISEKGAKRMDAFQGRNDSRHALSANSTAEARRS